MHIVHVFVHVKPEKVAAFLEATEDNAANSRREAGIARFDFLQQADDASRFLLVEVYRNEAAVASHKETAHYNRWREAVEPLLAEPRTRIVYRNVSPGEGGWG